MCTLWCDLGSRLLGTLACLIAMFCGRFAVTRLNDQDCGQLEKEKTGRKIHSGGD